MRKILLLLAGMGGGLCVFTGATNGWAQDATASASGANAAPGLETVIVTARKRVEDAQTVPIAITAFNQAELDKLLKAIR